MNPLDIKLAKGQISRVLDDLNLFLATDDEGLKLDMLEGETTMFEVVRRLLDDCEADDGLIAALKDQIAARQSRRERAETRIDRRKAAITSLMDAAFLTKLALPEATVSLRTLQPRPKITDLAALPDAFVVETIVRKPDNDAIAVAIEGGAEIPGVVMTNGSSSLTVRRK